MAKRSTYLRKQRDIALFESYSKAIQEHDFANQKEAFDYVRKHAAPRFFSSNMFCESMITKMLNGQPTGLKNPQAVRKYNELFRRYKQKAEQYPEKTIREICAIIVDEPAPEFYLNRRITQWIIAREKKERWEEIMKKMR